MFPGGVPGGSGKVKKGSGVILEGLIGGKRTLEAVLESSSWLQESPWTIPSGSRGVLESSRECLGERPGTILDKFWTKMKLFGGDF